MILHYIFETELFKSMKLPHRQFNDKKLTILNLTIQYNFKSSGYKNGGIGPSILGKKTLL